MRRLITVADDFGLSISVNEAVEHAARNGILTSASLMVAGSEAPDAVGRALRTPQLKVGLHLVVIEGRAMLPPSEIPDLVDKKGYFPSDQVRLGARYFFLPAVRRQLAAEIHAQFAAFQATGLALDHANAHKHMHMHPTVGRLMIEIGRAYGLMAIRVPAERGTLLNAGNFALRRQARRAGLLTNEHMFGLRHSGHMTTGRVQAMLDALPEGLTEMYFHPATQRDDTLTSLMPDYEHVQELNALLNARLPADVELTTYSRMHGRQEFSF